MQTTTKPPTAKESHRQSLGTGRQANDTSPSYTARGTCVHHQTVQLADRREGDGIRLMALACVASGSACKCKWLTLHCYHSLTVHRSGCKNLSKKILSAYSSSLGDRVPRGPLLWVRGNLPSRGYLCCRSKTNDRPNRPFVCVD